MPNPNLVVLVIRHVYVIVIESFSLIWLNGNARTHARTQAHKVPINKFNSTGPGTSK